jgi:hypothetical protein
MMSALRLATRLGARAVVAFLLPCVMLGSASASASASAFRRLDGNADAFATDGTRYAVWQYRPSHPIIVYDTQARHRGEIEDGCAIPSGGAGAADGRFLVYCTGGTALLDVRSGKLTPLPEPPGGSWEEVGSRYVATGYGQGVRCPGMRPHEGCLVLDEIATGKLSEVPERRLPDLNRPGAPPLRVCRAFRPKLLGEGEGAYGEGVFAAVIERVREGPRHWLLIQRCRGRRTLLHTDYEPKDLDIGGGLLTWDSGHTVGSDEEAERGFDGKRGALVRLDLATGRRRVWSLPALSVSGGGEPIFGVYGYSLHISHMVFWIADRSVSCGKGGCQPDSYYVYAARM